MSQNARRKTLFAIACVVLVGVCAVLYVNYVHRGQMLGLDMYQLYRAYAAFLLDHRGVLPSGVDDLVEAGYLRRVDHATRECYTESDGIDGYAPAYPGRVIRFAHLFEFAKHRSIAAFELRNDRVVVRNSGDEILFIRPPYAVLNKTARHHTLRDYKRAQSARASARENDAASGPDPDVEPERGE